MRPLTEQESKTFFSKLAKYIGGNIKFLIDRGDQKFCFRLHKDRVYYVNQRLLGVASSLGRERLISMGCCFGKFSKTRKFRLQITALDYLSQYAQNKIWIKPTVEQSLLYGNHVLKSGLAKITDETEKFQGVVLYSVSELPLGFGITARSTAECRTGTSADIVAFNQADIGAYLRDESSLI
ncbi:MAG: putative 60S ribosome subunit biogenesis protein NIP7 [Streblomastix strix]|uniref:60S ribosome subunit biogenesis protein NIP7 homolog n=1 Tax=Streblomastix strix TaxID=222440 RepID=A0A5J4V223_9EUKA|nr:MAG: putative 60S ribosome subunit biogenesis protein NIP7 [Streblomastix strix]